jgi:hypothetical protein
LLSFFFFSVRLADDPAQDTGIFYSCFLQIRKEGGRGDILANTSGRGESGTGSIYHILFFIGTLMRGAIYIKKREKNHS